MFVTLNNIASLVKNGVAFNGVTGVIMSEKKQAVFAQACDVHGYAKSVWATANQWDSLGLSIKGAKGKAVAVKCFIPAFCDGVENKEYKQALAQYLKIKEYNEKTSGRKHFNPYIQTKGGLIMNCYYYNVAECHYKDETNSAPVDLNIPVELRNNNSLALTYANSETADIFILENKSEPENIDAEIISENKNSNTVENAALIEELEKLRAENQALKDKLASLQALTTNNMKVVANALKGICTAFE